MLAFPFADAGEIAGKTGTATNADGKTSDVWLLVFVPGTPEHPEKGIVLGFWMGKDSKDHPLGERGSTGGPGFAESGARNWMHSAATVLGFLQKERGLLKPGYRFQPISRDEVLRNLDAKTTNRPMGRSPSSTRRSARIAACGWSGRTTPAWRRRATRARRRRRRPISPSSTPTICGRRPRSSSSSTR